MHKLISLILLLLSLSACTTMTKERCDSLEWEKVGRIDGRTGVLSNAVDHHEANCSGLGVEVDRSAYQRGHAIGLKEFCTEEAGYAAGEEGIIYQGQCPAESTTAFQSGYKKGRAVFLLKNRRSEVIKDIEDKRLEVQNDHSVAGDISKFFHSLSGTSPTDHLTNTKHSINKEIADKEAEAPVLKYDLHPTRQKTMQSALGAATGMIVGFGVGHAIQGRYIESGWKWTLGEAAVIGALVTTTSRCPSRIKEDGTRVTECQGALPMLSLLGFLAFRVWESVDLWRETSWIASGYSSELPPPGLSVGLKESTPQLLYTIPW